MPGSEQKDVAVDSMVGVQATNGQVSAQEPNVEVQPSQEASTSQKHSRTVELRITPLLAEARNMYGLRHKDYARYRRYCTDKVANLRKLSKTTQGSAKGKKFTRQPISEEIENVANTTRLLTIVLFDAERAWSHAMELKQLLVDSQRKRRHLIKRLNRAVKHAALLVDLSTKWNVSTFSRREISAYHSLLAGHAFFEKENYAEAVQAYLDAREHFELLADISPKKKCIPYNVSINTINPYLRYCAYNLTLRGLPTGFDEAILEPRATKPYKKKTHKKKGGEATVEAVAAITTTTPAAKKVTSDVKESSKEATSPQKKSTGATTKKETTKTEEKKQDIESFGESKAAPTQKERQPVTASINDEVDNYDDSDDDGFESAEEDNGQKKGWLSGLIWGGDK